MTWGDRNLDRLAAKYAQAFIAKTIPYKKAGDLDNSVTKALGVLQEDGVYACFLYIMAKQDVTVRNNLIPEMSNLLGNLGFSKKGYNNGNGHELLDYIANEVTTDLERLLLAKETLEQMLIYARYGAKAANAQKLAESAK